MKCPNSIHPRITAPTMTEEGLGYLLRCPDCGLYDPESGAFVSEEDKYSYNPGHRWTDDTDVDPAEYYKGIW